MDWTRKCCLEPETIPLSTFALTLSDQRFGILSRPDPISYDTKLTEEEMPMLWPSSLW